MKKLLSILLIAGLLFVAADASAMMNRFNQDQKVLVTTITNDTSAAGGGAAAGARLETLVTDTTNQILRPGYHRLLGYELGTLPNGGVGRENVEGIASIHDAAALADIRADDEKGTLEFEAEVVSSTEGSRTVWFPYPYAPKNGICVRQGYGTVVTLFYEESTR